MHRKAYQGLRVGNTYLNFSLRHAVSYAYHFSVTVTITISYAILRLLAHRSNFMMVVVGLLGLIMVGIINVILEFCIQHSLNLRYNSLEYVDSYFRNDFTLNKLERKVLKSCYPLEIEVGTLFKFTTRSFCLRLFGDIILQNIITLLLTFQG